MRPRPLQTVTCVGALGLDASVDLYFAPVPRLCDAIERGMADGMSDSDCERFERLRVEADRAAFLLSRALLRTALSTAIGRSSDALRFRVGAFGRPYALPKEIAPSFNLTHTAGLVCCAVSREAVVGVDAEVFRERPGSSNIEAVFTRSELRLMPQTARTACLLHGWTVKEAILKALGRGLSIDPAEVRVRMCFAGWTNRLAYCSPGGALRPDCKLISIQTGTGSSEEHFVTLAAFARTDVFVRVVPFELEGAARLRDSAVIGFSRGISWCLTPVASFEAH